MRALGAAPVVLLLAAAVAGAQSPPAAPRAPSAPKRGPEPGWKAEPFAIENEAHAFRLGLTGYVQADFRSYRDWTVATPDLRAPESEWHRVRVGIGGRYQRLSFQVDVGPIDKNGKELKDAWLELRLARAVRLRGGRLKVPVSPEWMTSPARTDFLERGVMVEAMAPDRDWGAELNGEIGKAVEYQAGVFAGDGVLNRFRAGTTYAGRLVFRLLRGVEVGGSTSYGRVAADPAGPGLDPDPKGFAAESQTEYPFFEPVFVDGRRQRWDAEASVRRGPFGFRAEYLQETEARRGQGPTLEDLPDVRGRGFQVAATWLVTGEKKVRTIRPDARLFRGPGAVELGLRYEEMRVDDVANEGFEGFGNRARNLRPAGYRALTGGISWWPTVFLRLSGNVVAERYRDTLAAPETGRANDYVSLLGRVQVMLP
jgi:phosphate-selective porin